MIEVVGGVKSILFGDAESTALVAGPPPGEIAFCTHRYFSRLLRIEFS
jgi:hypothetical protein